MLEFTPINISGRSFDCEQIVAIRKIIAESPECLRTEISRRVCEHFDWRDTQGKLKAMSCRVALLRLHRDGHIQLPAPRNGNGNGKPLSVQCVDLPDARPISCPVNELEGLGLHTVHTKAESALWNTLIDQHHYLGYQPLPGAQLRYLIRWQGGLLGAIGWGAAAWKVAPRDRWLGWSTEQRKAALPLVLNNARFLILPWVQCRNLASKVLSLSERCVADDFEQRYGIRPVLLETFVEKQRFRGTCYRAANWQHLGHTQGRGKCDRDRTARLPIKDLYVRPLSQDFRQILGAVE
jgi:hypothetical protein